jgi:hypothetical protein
MVETLLSRTAPRRGLRHREVGHYGRSLNEVAEVLGCDWHTVNDAVIAYGALADHHDRFAEVVALRPCTVREGEAGSGDALVGLGEAPHRAVRLRTTPPCLVPGECRRLPEARQVDEGRCPPLLQVGDRTALGAPRLRSPTADMDRDRVALLLDAEHVDVGKPTRISTIRAGSVSTLLLGSTRFETLAGQHAQSADAPPFRSEVPVTGFTNKSQRGGPIKYAAS